MLEKPYFGRVLIVDDDEYVRRFYSRALELNGFSCDEAANASELRTKMEQRSFAAILLDLGLGDERGIDSLPYIFREAPFTKIFVLTSENSVDAAVDCMQRGATSFFIKGEDIEKHIKALQESCVSSEHRDNNSTGGQSLQQGLVGTSPAITEVYQTIHRLRDVDSTVLILGESGSGKEVVARALHKTSARASNQFEAINCAAIPENLLESELFGHKRGAFTDAKSDRKGLFEITSNGTLLLDEIGDLPLSLQAKLLRVLQERIVTPVGSNTSIPIHTRLIAATHRNLKDEIIHGSFREDLFFRLSVVVIQIPPLRERVEDIAPLVMHFLNEFNVRFKKNIVPPGESILGPLRAYQWPGNVRELRNAVERGVVLAQGDELNLKDMLQPMAGLEPNGRSTIPIEVQEIYKMFDLTLNDAKKSFEREYVQHWLKETHGNISALARRTGRYRADIYRLIERYKIDTKTYR